MFFLSVLNRTARVAGSVLNQILLAPTTNRLALTLRGLKQCWCHIEPRAKGRMVGCEITRIFRPRMKKRWIGDHGAAERNPGEDSARLSKKSQQNCMAETRLERESF